MAIERDVTEMSTWTGGAKRSKAMPPWWMIPRKALRGILTRFEIGKKYGIHNWKKTLGVPRNEWRVGEDTGTSPLDFVRQFLAHADEHLANALELADAPADKTSPKGDNFIENLSAYAWNVICMLEYALENEDMVREALSQWPVGHPKHREDLNVPQITYTNFFTSRPINLWDNSVLNTGIVSPSGIVPPKPAGD